MTLRWNVWSFDLSTGQWMVVVENVPLAEAEEALASRRAAALRYDRTARFEAAPVGQEPESESTDLLAEKLIDGEPEQGGRAWRMPSSEEYARRAEEELDRAWGDVPDVAYGHALEVRAQVWATLAQAAALRELRGA